MPPELTRLPPRPALTPRPSPLRRKKQAAARFASSRRDVSALTPRQRLAWLALGVIWLLVGVQFWTWWIPRAAGGDAALAVVVSASLAYQAFLLPTAFWYYLGRMRRPAAVPAPAGLRVAVITLCVPSMESVDVIDRQLAALAAIRYPHDSWILDEGDSDAVRRLANLHGVHYFTRKGIERWNQPGPPHQRGTKAGNVNAWLDHVAESEIEYDAFVQLDIDHRPDPDYLDCVLGYLGDPKVAWVQAPSVYDNLERWTARGLAEQDLVLQGPLQMGFFGTTGTPFIIGSHTTYRMSAVREIGGFQPTRAEDHLDTVVLASHGYRGVFVPDVIAVGDGPEDLGTYLRQQFAWARSMFTVLLTETPRRLRRYHPLQGAQFLFAQTWYPLWSLSLLALWAAPIVALIGGGRIADARFDEYLLYFVPVALIGWAIWHFSRPFHRPRELRLSWRGAVVTIARWPAVLWALISVLLRIDRPYMVTPKGGDGAGTIGLRSLSVHGPMAAFASFPVAAPWIAAAGQPGDAHSYVLLALLSAVAPLIAFASGLLLELRELPGWKAVGSLAPGHVVLLGWLWALGVSLAITAAEFWQPILGVFS